MKTLSAPSFSFLSVAPALLLGGVVLASCSAGGPEGTEPRPYSAGSSSFGPANNSPSSVVGGNVGQPGVAPAPGAVPATASREGQPTPALAGPGMTPGAVTGGAPGSVVGGAPVATLGDGETPSLIPAAVPTLVRGQGEALVQDSAALLRLAYTFYGAQRSGDGANWLLDDGEACHTNDGEVIGRDLSGGWYDAGDHLKVTLSISYGMYVSSKGYDAFPSVFDDRDSERYGGAANGVPDVLDEIRYGADWLVKAHIAPNQLVAMIGEINSDHGLPLRNGRCSSQQANGIQRPVSMQSNADVAGLASAALALASRLYRPFDATLASSYLQHAREIYQIAKANPRGSDPGLYGQTDPRFPLAWADEALCGAAELYRATGEQQYLTDALAYDEMVGSHQWAPNFSQSADFCRHSLIVGLRDAGNLAAAQPVAFKLKTDIDNYIAHVSTEPNTVGMMHMDEWGSLRYASGAAFGASLYYEVTGDTTARDLALSQLNYIMGDNSYNRSFVIGFGNNPPSQPHHRNQIATGNSLVGALVGGPTNGSVGPHQAGYQDNADDYLGNEVALDYNAGLVGLAAFGAAEARR